MTERDKNDKDIMTDIYFIGIGGIGMSAIARYYNAKGFRVSGYDKTLLELSSYQMCTQRFSIQYH